MTPRDDNLPGSFRDPCGFVFRRDGELFRQVNPSYREHYDLLMGSGLYGELADAGLLVRHDEVAPESVGAEGAYKALRPEPVPFVSYPYEWCFGQLRAAALATLEIQQRALAHGMTLKDSSAYNIQFLRGRAVLIDTLSFEAAVAGRPWVAYRQFCQHFLAPLALMAYRDVRLGQLFRLHVDGVPLDLASRLLPRRTWLRFSLLSHIHLHARGQRYFADKDVKVRERRMGKYALLGLLDNLQAAVRRLRWRVPRSAWAAYYDETSYSEAAMARKEQLVGEMLDRCGAGTVWDLGANTGRFSRIAAERGIETVALEADPACVELLFRDGVERGEERILPLVADLTNPSPGIGWANLERAALVDRGPADAVLALALVHHLAIANNVPLPRIASFLARLSAHLVVEFVPKGDPQVERLLRNREDIFADYDEEGFERAFGAAFGIERKERLPDSPRVLYLLRAREGGA